MPTLLENGHLLVFDNGVHRDFSRVLEVNPVTEEIVWQYRAADFYSQWRGSNQRLPNGNTLICESQNGRVFEVTPAGEVVWEFHNPEMKRKKRKRIYRMMRYSPEQMDALLGGRFRIGP
jgi:outer membrane protein assembly factor BamB